MGTGQAASSARERAASEPGSSATEGLTFIPGRPRKFMNINEYWVSEGHLCHEGVGLCRNRICWADRELRPVALCAFVLLQRSSLKLMCTRKVVLCVHTDIFRNKERRTLALYGIRSCADCVYLEASRSHWLFCALGEASYTDFHK